MNAVKKRLTETTYTRGYASRAGVVTPEEEMAVQ
jgi:hypothetical protein